MPKHSPSFQSSDATVPANLEERLNRHPELKAKIESLLSVVENAEGEVSQANAADLRVIEEIRQLGQAALQGWATRQNQVQNDTFVKNNPNAHRTRQKNSTGIVALEASKS